MYFEPSLKVYRQQAGVPIVSHKHAVLAVHAGFTLMPADEAKQHNLSEGKSLPCLISCHVKHFSCILPPHYPRRCDSERVHSLTLCLILASSLDNVEYTQVFTNMIGVPHLKPPICRTSGASSAAIHSREKRNRLSSYTCCPSP